MRSEREGRERIKELYEEAHQAELDGDIAYMEHRDWEAAGISWMLNDKSKKVK